MATLSIIGILVGLVLMCFLMFKGIHPLIAAVAASAVIALTGGLNVYEALTGEYMAGFVGFIQSNFPIFVTGAFLGKVYEVTNGATAIAHLLVKAVGKRFSAIVVPLAISVMTFCGIVGYVVCFAMFPIALAVYREADIPRRFIPTAIVVGCCTFTSYMPFEAQVPNVSATNILGTSLSAGAVIGTFAGLLQAVISMALLTILVSYAQKRGEHFVAHADDKFGDDSACPGGVAALVPLIITLVAINIKDGSGNAYIPVEAGILAGSILAYIVMRGYHTDGTNILGHAATAIGNAIISAAATSALVAVGTVTKATAGWDPLINTLTSIPGPALLSASVGGILFGGVCASASGATALTAELFGSIYAAKGVTMTALHRTLVTACHVGGTLPNNGFINTVVVGICKDTYKNTYAPMFLCVPVSILGATVVSVILFTLFPGLP